LQDIDPEDFHHFLPLCFPERNKIFPVGIFIPDKTPVNAESKIEEENESGDEMDEAYRTEPVAERSLGPAGDRNGPADQVACYGQYHYAKGIDPVVKPDRELPDILFL
jgi:hypothetical protein